MKNIDRFIVFCAGFMCCSAVVCAIKGMYGACFGDSIIMLFLLVLSTAGEN